MSVVIVLNWQSTTNSGYNVESTFPNPAAFSAVFLPPLFVNCAHVPLREKKPKQGVNVAWLFMAYVDLQCPCKPCFYSKWSGSLIQDPCWSALLL